MPASGDANVCTIISFSDSVSADQPAKRMKVQVNDDIYTATNESVRFHERLEEAAMKLQSHHDVLVKSIEQIRALALRSGSDDQPSSTAEINSPFCSMRLHVRNQNACFSHSAGDFQRVPDALPPAGLPQRRGVGRLAP